MNIIFLEYKESGADSNLALLSLRSTPQSTTLKSPAELLNGRMSETTLPVKICPPNDQKKIRNLLATHNKKQLNVYNRGSKQKLLLFQDFKMERSNFKIL